MNFRLPALALVATLLTSTHAMANLELAKSKACMACHQLDKKVVGPSYKDVAKKYAGKKGAESQLIEKVIKGGKGAWGEVPMPANSQVTPAEAKQLVQWILKLK